MEDIKEYYQANVESLDFAHAAQESQKKINTWVESQTNGIVWRVMEEAPEIMGWSPWIWHDPRGSVENLSEWQ